MGTSLVATALSVCWADPGGRDGVSADLRTFAAFAVHGGAVITGIRAGGILSPFPTAEIEKQIRSAVVAAKVAAAKLSVFSTEADGAIAPSLRAHGIGHLVLDASSTSTGNLTRESVETIKATVASSISVLLTDVAGVQALVGVKVANQGALRAVAKLLGRWVPGYVLVTGSQLPGEEVVDIMFGANQTWEFPGERFAGPEPDGLASTYAAAVTAGLAHGRSVEEAVAIARIYVTEAQRTAFVTTGPEGATPITNQLHAWWSGVGRQGYGG